MLEGLLDENDQDPNVWLLLAMCCQGGGDEEGALGAGECWLWVLLCGRGWSACFRMHTCWRLAG